MGWRPSYRVEARIYGRYILKNLPDAKIGVLYQNDDFGEDYLIGLRQALGDRADKLIVATQTYETTDPTVDSQIVALQASGANVLLTAAITKTAAQAIRTVYDVGWKPTHFLTSVSISVGAVMRPAGPEKCIDIITAETLIIWGEDDALISSVYAGEFAKRIAKSRVEIIKDCGHVPQVERLDVIEPLVV
jgi:branched-chain amino acid transport system substrate-binding protein